MREIKVKAWSPSKKCWRSDWSISTYEEVLDLNEERMDDDLIIVQYTGLKDIDGKEIYEGDIISVEYDGEKKIYKVVWYEQGMFTIYPYEDGPGYIPTLGHFVEGGDIDFDYITKIVGNIYENPELLK